MKKLLKSACALAVPLVMLSIVQASALTDSECQAEWTRADINKDGFISAMESTRLLGAMRFANKNVDEKGLSQADFTTNCRSGLFDVRRNEEGAPLKGANSFTESQAAGRAESYGFTAVTGLSKDADGIWRGKAMKDGQSVPVAIDYRGNVVSQ